MAIFSDPVAQAIITDPDSGQEWKWTAPEFPFLTGCSLEYERGRIAVMTLSFDIPYDDGLKLMEMPSPFKQNNLVKARIGYAGGTWTPWSSGFLAAGGDGLSLDANGVSGQITVQGVAESYGYTVDKTLLREAGWDPIKILTACAGMMGLKLKTSAGASSELNAYKLVGEKRGKATKQKTFAFSSSLVSLSAWEIVKKICGEWNLAFWMGPEVGSADPGTNLFIYTKAELSKGVDQDTAIRTYMVRGVIDEANLIYPCFAWSPEGSTFVAWLASQPDAAAHGVDAAGCDADTGEIKEEPIAPKEQAVAIDGVTANDEPTDLEVDGIKGDVAKGDGSKGAYISMPFDAGTEDRQKTQLQSRQGQGNAAQRGTITALGISDERSGNLCELRGAGAIFDGTYEVHKVSHVYAPGSWEMTLTVQRDGRKDKGGAQDETSEGQMPQK